MNIWDYRIYGQQREIIMLKLLEEMHSHIIDSLADGSNNQVRVIFG